MVLLKIFCNNVGNLENDRISKIMAFSFAEMELEDALLLQIFMNNGTSFVLFRRHHELQKKYVLKIKIISDPLQITAIKEIFNFETEFNSTDFNFIRAIKICVAQEYYQNILTAMKDKYKSLFGLSLNLEDILYACEDFRDIQNFENELSNVFSVIAIQKLILPNQNLEIGVLKLIRSYVNTRDYDCFLKSEFPNLY